MSTSYDIVDKRFIYKVEDEFLLKLTQSDREELLDVYRDVSEVNFKKCKKFLEKNDTLREYPDLTNEEIEILATGMVTAWLSPKINSAKNMKQQMTTKDYKIYSQANQIDVIQKVKEATHEQVKLMISDYVRENNLVDFKNWRNRI